MAAGVTFQRPVRQNGTSTITADPRWAAPHCPTAMLPHLETQPPPPSPPHHHAVTRVALHRVDVLQARRPHVRLNVVLVVLVAVRLRAAGRGRTRQVWWSAREDGCLRSPPHVLQPFRQATWQCSKRGQQSRCAPHLFMSVNSTGGRFWMTCTVGRGGRQAAVAEPAHRQLGRHPATSRRAAVAMQRTTLPCSPPCCAGCCRQWPARRRGAAAAGTP